MNADQSASIRPIRVYPRLVLASKPTVRLCA
jgi:hypothetical protein